MLDGENTYPSQGPYVGRRKYISISSTGTKHIEQQHIPGKHVGYSLLVLDTEGELISIPLLIKLLLVGNLSNKILQVVARALGNALACNNWLKIPVWTPLVEEPKRL